MATVMHSFTCPWLPVGCFFNPPPLQDKTAQQWNAQLRVLGDLTLAPQGLQAAAAQLMLSSAGPGTTSTVNIFFCYT
jgi:hypothetical protein